MAKVKEAPRPSEMDLSPLDADVVYPPATPAVQGANMDPTVKMVFEQLILKIRQQFTAAGFPPSMQPPGEIPPPGTGTPPGGGSLPATVPADIAILYEAVNGILGLLDTQATYINNISQILNTETSLTNAGSYPADCPVNNQEMYSLGPPQTQG